MSLCVRFHHYMLSAYPTDLNDSRLYVSFEKRLSLFRLIKIIYIVCCVFVSKVVFFFRNIEVHGGFPCFASITFLQLR